MAEVVDHGVTGFVADGVNEAVAAVASAKPLDRRAIRRRFEERFSVEQMARDYLAVYSKVLRRGPVGVLTATAADQPARESA